MTKPLSKITMLWKFFYWPLAWLLVFAPGIAWPLALAGIWLMAVQSVGALLLVYALFLSSTGGRTLAKLAHQDAHETFWPDKFTASGIFKCMRHPMHQGLAIFPVAMALLSGRILAIAASGWGVAAALWFVIYIEEKDALEKYDQTYSNYMLRVPPFSWKWNCVKIGLQIWKRGNQALDKV